METARITTPAARVRSRVRYSLAALLLCVSVVSVGLAIWTQARERRKREDDVVLRLHARVDRMRCAVPELVETMLGDRLASDFAVVTSCTLHGIGSPPSVVHPGVMEDLKELSALESLKLRSYRIDASGARQLSQLRLRSLDVAASQLDASAIAILRQSPSIDQVITASQSAIPIEANSGDGVESRTSPGR